jgi:hypothetical protein
MFRASEFIRAVTTGETRASHAEPTEVDPTVSIIDYDSGHQIQG